MFCPKCGWQNPDNTKVCSACGAPFPAPANNLPFSDMNQYENLFPDDTKTVALTPEQAAANQAAYEQAAYQTPYPQPNAPFAGQNTYQGGYTQPNRQNYRIGSIYNSDYSPYAFQNPYVGLLTFLIILGFLIAIFANCGMFRFDPDFYTAEDNLQYFPLFPMWLLTVGFFVSFSDMDTRQNMLAFGDSRHLPLAQLVGIFLTLMTLMALIIFIYSCVVAFQASLKRRTARQQLIGMNIFLTVNWIFWFFYTFSILSIDYLIWKDSRQWEFILQYSVFAWLHTICLVLMTILRLIYGRKVTAAYNLHLNTLAQMRYPNGMYNR